MSREEQERRLLLDIFPEELWLQIFDSAENPDHLIAVANASLLWKELLEPKMAEYLFPQVLNILVKKNVLETSDTHTILMLRLVSKAWKLGVNRLLENGGHHKNIKFDYYHHDTKSSIAYPTRFNLYSSKILEKLEAEILPAVCSPLYNTVNPFPSRHLEIRESNLLANGLSRHHRYRMYNTTKQFLQKAGHHFWYADISLGFFLSTTEWYGLICQYVEFMPNLQSIYINKTTSLSFDDLTELTNQPQFPQLKNLKLLSLGNIPRSVMNVIFAANRGIQILIVPRIGGHASEGVEFQLIQNPSTVSVCIQNWRDFNNLPSDWNPVVLRLGFHPTLSLHWSSVFRQLENYKETLVDLYLVMPRATNDDDKLTFWISSLGKLNLPLAKMFYLDVGNYCSLDFTLGLLSLERMTLHFKHRERSVPPHQFRRQIINVDFDNEGLPTRFMECNIWNRIPTLITFEFKSSSQAVQYKRGKTLTSGKNEMESIL